MELSIKLDLRKTGKTPKGFPVVVYASKNYKNRKWRTGYYALKTEWNERIAAPKTKHPKYYEVMEYLSGIKIRISNILADHKNENKSLADIKALLFKKNYQAFYTAAIASFDKDYKGTQLSAVRAFNKHYPNLLFDEINQSMALKFRDVLLKNGNKPAGVDSYIRSLKAVWNKLSTQPNPFKGVSVEIPEKINTVATLGDISKLILCNLGDLKRIGGYANYRNYWLLMFYLGGIDPEALAKLRYDENVINGRIIFNRNKGRSKKLCNNVIPQPAWDILQQYDCKPYLVPIHKSNNYDTFSGNFSERMKKLSKDLGLSVQLRPKSARYTFIDRAQQLLIDERIAAQIVGHERKTTTSIYTNDFPQSVQDESHKRVINISNSVILSQ